SARKKNKNFRGSRTNSFWPPRSSKRRGTCVQQAAPCLQLTRTRISGMKNAVAVFALGLLTCAGPVMADGGVSVDVGRSSESTTLVRVSVQNDLQSGWWQSDVGRLTGYWDLAYQYWNGDDSSSMLGLSLSPVFVFEFSRESVRPYVELGIGIA